MAEKHVLSLDIPEVTNPSVFKVVDTSVYVEGWDTECARLDITVPGFSDIVYITESLPNNFTRIITAEDLNILGASDETMGDLPDGVYKIKYSIAPNADVYVEYYHLRTTKILNLYYSELCKVHLDFCEPTPAVNSLLSHLRLIKSYIDSAKAMVETCHSPNLGMDMLNYALRELLKIKDTTCKNC